MVHIGNDIFSCLVLIGVGIFVRKYANRTYSKIVLGSPIITQFLMISPVYYSTCTVLFPFSCAGFLFFLCKSHVIEAKALSPSIFIPLYASLLGHSYTFFVMKGYRCLIPIRIVVIYVLTRENRVNRAYIYH